jgi:hypothetical protein
MEDESEKKTKALAEAVGKHAETLRSLLRRNPRRKGSECHPLHP